MRGFFFLPRSNTRNIMANWNDENYISLPFVQKKWETNLSNVLWKDLSKAFWVKVAVLLLAKNVIEEIKMAWPWTSEVKYFNMRYDKEISEGIWTTSDTIFPNFYVDSLE